jgi:GH15 family glucan-1,4-alpha-glucosidase
MHPPVPYSAIGRHGVVGDRRTAALIAEDGTIDWLCLPDYDGDIVFGGLLDSQRGGTFRIGPAAPRIGSINHEANGASHVTGWRAPAGEVTLSDVMVWPARDASSAHHRQAVVRHLQCTRGRIACELNLRSARNFFPMSGVACSANEIRFACGANTARLWCDRPLLVAGSSVTAEFELSAGEEAWAVFSLGDLEPWSIDRTRRLKDEAEGYWKEWLKTLSFRGPHEQQVRRAGLLIHMLSHAPTGSLVAAPTASLPERIGGDWNADYRCAWVRDASLSLTALSWLGNTDDCKHYLEWLSTLGSSTAAPLQPLYGIRGEQVVEQQERHDLYGYRGSQPVRFGNHAYRQSQLDAFGYLAECMHVYLDRGGSWEPRFWDLLERCANYVCANWRDPGNSVWELSVVQHYLSAKVMSWTALDRAIRVAEQLNKTHVLERWRAARDAIWADVMQRGWNDRLQSFRQRYEGDNLDAAALLVPIMDFLPPDHPRVHSTIQRVADRLAIDQFVYRFDPTETPGFDKGLPLGEFEGAFLPCTFWLATALIKIGRVDEGEAILNAVDSLTPSLGVFAEGFDVRTREFTGNMPLLFSHVEYVRAARELGCARLSAKGPVRQAWSIGVTHSKSH